MSKRKNEIETRIFYSSGGDFPQAQRWMEANQGFIDIVGTTESPYKSGTNIKELKVFYKEK